MIASHIIYIPLVLFAGIIIGFLLARQQGGFERSEAARRLKARADRKSRPKESSADSERQEPR